MPRRHLALAVAAAALAVLSIAVACTVASTQGRVEAEPAHAYSPFTVEVAVSDAGVMP